MGLKAVSPQQGWPSGKGVRVGVEQARGCSHPNPLFPLQGVVVRGVNWDGREAFYNGSPDLGLTSFSP
jgi:hypothetical protein